MTATAPRRADTDTHDLEIAQLRAQLAQCQQRGQKLAEQNKEMRAYLTWQRDLFSRADLSGNEKLTLWAERGEWEHALRKEGEDVPTPEDMPQDAPPLRIVYRDQIVARTGLSESTITDTRQRLARKGFLHVHTKPDTSTRTGLPVQKTYVAPTRAALLAPKSITIPDEAKSNHGGRRIACASCGSDDVIEHSRYICRACGTEWGHKDHEVNASADPAPEPFSLRLPQTRNTIEAATCPQGEIQDAPQAGADDDTTDKPSPFAGCKWYDATRPDNELSQGLSWALYEDVGQATLWYGAQRLQDQFRKGPDAPILTVTGRGRLRADDWLLWLRQQYMDGHLKKLQDLARVWGLDPTRIQPLLQDLGDPEEGDQDGQA